MKVSVIIPTYNEEKVIGDCLESLAKQTYKDMEVFVIDDGSTDQTTKIFKTHRLLHISNHLLQQIHQGPGIARNLGAKYAKGEILVFLDADMTFEKKFIQMLIKPIVSGKCIGTFSKDEFVLNKENVWSKCWNINKGLPLNRMHPKNYPDEQKVFRAILKKEFNRAGGFSPIGYIDDYTISEKLGKNAYVAKDAIFYHGNPESLSEVYKQARWIGKSEYKRRKIKNENLMRIISLIRYSPPLTLIHSCTEVFRYRLPQYFLFKAVYDFAVEMSLVKSFFKEQYYK